MKPYMNIIEIDRTLGREKAIYDVVGPVCETSDFLGKQRELAIAEGDYIAQTFCRSLWCKYVLKLQFSPTHG